MAQSPEKRNIASASGGKAIVADVSFDGCRAVNCATAGSSTVTWIDGSSTTYYFTQGINPIQITLVASGGAASGLVALY